MSAGTILFISGVLVGATFVLTLNGVFKRELWLRDRQIPDAAKKQQAVEPSKERCKCRVIQHQIRQMVGGES